ncbi:MAG TPA: tetratricopeptide repeat protein [Gemmatimonadales bacterium]|jgi:tetratricopeptide (TPR) repeat protein|nr:tetratricopeptide repeat protein [Gemmatimonadales bacterium]
MRALTLATIVGLGLSAPAAPVAAQSGIQLPGKLADLRVAARRDSNDALAHYYVGLAYLNDAKWVQADSALRMAVLLDARLAEAYLALSYIPYLRRPQLYREELRGRVPKDWQPAVEDAARLNRRAFAVDPLMDLRVLSVLFPVDQRGFRDYTSVESRIYELFFEGFDDLAAGRYPAAEQRLTRLAQQVYYEDKKPQDVPDFLLWARGLAAAHQGKFEVAIGDFQKLFDRSLKKEEKQEVITVPLRTNEYRYILAVLHHLAGRLDRAVELYQEAAAQDLSLYMAHVQLATIHEGAQRVSEALAERQRAVQANPEEPTLELDLALAYYQGGAREEAETHLQRAVELNPRDARFHYLRGVIAQELDRPADARTYLTRCVELAPQRLARITNDARARLAALPQ